ncbi:hypothetical protein [Streptomyces sp. NPDC093261]|uniref:hypothetical protein n=1 Tax=Streptomyces sp. NPDC093261 TaxID=3366037 RepID=UPI00382D43C7
MATIAPDNKPLTWTAKFWRYHSLYEKEKCDSLEEAARFLLNGEDVGTLSSDSIIGPDGSVVRDFQTDDWDNHIWAFADSLFEGGR